MPIDDEGHSRRHGPVAVRRWPKLRPAEARVVDAVKDLFERLLTDLDRAQDDASDAEILAAHPPARVCAEVLRRAQGQLESGRVAGAPLAGGTVISVGLTTIATASTAQPQDADVPRTSSESDAAPRLEGFDPAAADVPLDAKPALAMDRGVAIAPSPGTRRSVLLRKIAR